VDQSLNKQILTALSVEGADLRSYSALALAFIGDSIYELIVRTGVVGKGNVSPQKLNAMTSHLSKAPAQAAIAKAFIEQLSDEEADVFRRGKNSKPHTMAKNASKSDYLEATGLEALFGFLYLKGDLDRILELFNYGLKHSGYSI